MDKWKVRRLIREAKKAQYPFWLNRALDEEEIKWLYDHAERPKHEVWWFYEEGKYVYYWPDGKKY